MIQPFCHVADPEQLVPLLDTHTVTNWPSLRASSRAYIRSPSRQLASADKRYEFVMSRYVGRPTVRRIARIAMTTISSISDTPVCLFMAPQFTGAEPRAMR